MAATFPLDTLAMALSVMKNHRGCEHEHGGGASAQFEKHGISPVPVLDFSVSISPLGPPPIVIDAWPSLINTVSKYPSQDGSGIRRYYSEIYGMSEKCVLPGNGSVELMYRCIGALPIKRVALVCPSFFDYENALNAAGVQVETIYLSSENSFAAPSLKSLQSRIADCDGIILGNPNNPTGTVFDKEMLLALADQFPSKFFFVDEAFLPFMDSEQKRTLIWEASRRDNLVVFHSLTKIFAIPGLRAGCLVSSLKTIGSLLQATPPWMNNGMVDTLAPMLIDCESWKMNVRSLVKAEMARLRKACNLLGKINSYDGEVNFALIQTGGDAVLNAMLKQMLQSGILVRDCRNFRGLGEGFFRSCIRMPDDNQRLIQFLQKYFAD